ncbi:MAG: flagellar hook-basal body complex protein FliE [Legionellales bacterium]|nr:flagellar hook-basal body complex protein FliE [Legionellales bacterium]
MSAIDSQISSTAFKSARDDMLNEARQMVEKMRRISGSHEQGVSPISETPTGEFAKVFKDAIGEVNTSQTTSTNLIKAYELGDKNVSLTEVILAVQKARVASQLTLTVRNHLIEAYQTIMNMPV